MATGEQIAEISPKYLGTPYSKMDCQAFVEKCLADCGLRKDLAGSNAWYRFLMGSGWVGTPEECRKRFGYIPKGAFLYIHAFDGGEEKRGYHDGMGNASHIGLYTGMTGKQMADIAKSYGVTNPAAYDYGGGAINSSSTRGCVATSKFAGKTIKGGWNRIGLWREIDYGANINRILRGMDPAGGGETMTATVVLPAGASGNNVNMRTKPSTGSALVERVPVGATVEVLTDQGQWCQIGYNGLVGWMMSNYLEYTGQGGESGGDVITEAERLTIENALNEIDNQMEIIRSALGRG